MTNARKSLATYLGGTLAIAYGLFTVAPVFGFIAAGIGLLVLSYSFGVDADKEAAESPQAAPAAPRFNLAEEARAARQSVLERSQRVARSL